MSEPVTWTASMDESLRRWRLTGASWAVIALALGLGRETVRERGRRIGALRHMSPVVEPVATSSNERPPMRPGHEVSWGLLTRGTVLDGEAYPLPWFN